MAVGELCLKEAFCRMATFRIFIGVDLCLLRAAIDLHEDTETVCFDFGNAVGMEDVDPATAFTRDTRSSLLEGARAIEKVVVLTEGKADSRILQASLERLYPHIKHLYS